MQQNRFSPMEGEGRGGSNFSISSSSSRSSKITALDISPLDSTLIRYLRSQSLVTAAASPNYRRMIGRGFGSQGPSRSPLASIENFYTPPSRSPPAFKVEEDVVVMDGILVGDVTRGLARSSAGGKGRSSPVSDSGGSSSRGSVSRPKVARGKGELCPSRFPNKQKSEAKICMFTSSSSCSHDAKCPFIHHHASESESLSYVRAMATPKVPTLLPRKLENSSTSSSSINSYTLSSSVWSPLDDGIAISLPPPASTDEIPSREAVNSYIDGVLYGPSRGKRLPIFAEICPE